MWNWSYSSQHFPSRSMIISFISAAGKKMKKGYGLHLLLWQLALLQQQRVPQGGPLSSSAAGCVQHLPLSGTPLRALQLWSSRLLGLNYRYPSLLEPLFHWTWGDFLPVPLSMYIVSVCVCESVHIIIFYCYDCSKPFNRFVNAKLTND